MLRKIWANENEGEFRYLALVGFFRRVTPTSLVSGSCPVKIYLRSTLLEMHEQKVDILSLTDFFKFGPNLEKLPLMGFNARLGMY